MQSGNASGFWSYVHADDDASHGRIAQLARDIVAEYEMQTAEAIDLFLDRDDLSWGQAWKDVINQALASVAFFVPVITPRFFKSVECRREMTQFTDEATALGVRQLVMPILWVDVPALRMPKERDDLMDAIVDIQWVDWTQLRHAARNSSEYTLAVEKLAKQLVEANAIVDQVDLATQAANLGEPDAEEDESGVLERLAEMELAMPEWTTTVEAMSADIRALGHVAEEGTAEIKAGGAQTQSFAGRLTLLRKIAARLQGPADDLQAHGEQFISRLVAVDRGVQVLIAGARDEVAGDPSARAAFDLYFDSLRNLDDEAQVTVINTEGLLQSVVPLQKLSRDMKKPTQSISNGLVRLREGVDVIHGWVEQIDGLGWENLPIDE